ncbi:MAG: transcriptional regulator [Candidatus Sumerlaeota bacterium]|nr:transcriptional regulator [Candidatus Sumerlaeota bacterium]
MSKTKTSDAPRGRYSYEGLDRVMHEKARLGILTSLMTHPEGLIFTELKELCSLTDGNLSRHLQILEEAGLAQIWKSFHNRRPQTLVRLTPEGRVRFIEYLAALEQVVRDSEAARVAAVKESKSASSRPKSAPHGWAPA